MPEWEPQRAVDRKLAYRLISRHFTPIKLEPLGAGWDNTVWLANNKWAFRFPRREIALPGFRRELALLPRLDLPHDPMGRADMDVRIPKTRAILKEVEPIWEPPPSILQALADATGLGPLPPSAVVHGDLHARHILLDHGKLTGVIDWGDACLGDPCIDLALTWFALTPDGRADFFAAYGPVTEDQLLRARILSVFMCATLAVYGANEGNEFLVRDALAGLRRSS